METKEISIRINLESREFEIKGDSNYVNDHYGDYIMECLGIIKSSSNLKKNDQSPPSNTKHQSQSRTESGNDGGIPDSFGEYLNKFPKTISNVDKLLIACYHVQSKNDNKAFTISEASSLLINQGIKLSNPNSFNKANLDAKKIFKLTGNNYRVSETGVNHIKSVMTT
ncbi:MAG TPA: hypothetical protein VK668_19455 [Mucilaginibacter sp.]|nr:hypothetical protein [Mucilaginibacter sp.]